MLAARPPEVRCRSPRARHRQQPRGETFRREPVGLGAEPADDMGDRGAGQAVALAGPVEVDEQRIRLGFAASSQARNAALVGGCKVTGSFRALASSKIKMRFPGRSTSST